MYGLFWLAIQRLPASSMAKAMGGVGLTASKIGVAWPVLSRCAGTSLSVELAVLAMKRLSVNGSMVMAAGSSIGAATSVVGMLPGLSAYDGTSPTVELPRL